jgi:hypothetical protein
MICNVCQVTFETQRGLNIHKKKVHKDTTLFRCEYCQKTVSRQGVLEKHLLICDKKHRNNNQPDIPSAPPSQIQQIQQQNNYNVQNNYQINAENITIVCNNNTTKKTWKDIKSKLIPITLNSLTNSIENIVKKTNGNGDLPRLILEDTLKYSVVLTDKSRGVCHWIDGDNNNNEIKDTQCIKLGVKTVEASKEIANVYYKKHADLVEKRLKELHEAQAEYDVDNDATYHKLQAKIQAVDDCSEYPFVADIVKHPETKSKQIGEGFTKHAQEICSFQTREEQLQLSHSVKHPKLLGKLVANPLSSPDELDANPLESSTALSEEKVDAEHSEHKFLVQMLSNLTTNRYGGFFYMSPYEIGSAIICCIGPKLECDYNSTTERKTYFFLDTNKEKVIITYEMFAKSWKKAFTRIIQSYDFNRIIEEMLAEPNKETYVINYLEQHKFLIQDNKQNYSEKLYRGFMQMPKEE